jgi:hypothetical protein
MWPFKWKPKIKETIDSTELRKRLQVIVPSDCIIYCLDREYKVPENPLDVMVLSIEYIII